MFEAIRQDDEKNLLEKGFTLVELLIVVVILGILAGIVVFAVGNLTSSATKNACASEADTFTTAIEAYKAQATPVGSMPDGDVANAASLGTPNQVAAVLQSAGLLSKPTVKYGVAGAATTDKWGFAANNSGTVTPHSPSCVA